MSVQNNGTAAAANGRKPQPPAQEATAPVVSILTKEKPVKEKPDLPPLEDRLHRLNELFALQKKYDRLKASQTKLSEFEIQKQGEQSSITIRDEHRNDFTTYNPEIIREVVEFMKVKTAEKIKAIEPLLNW